MTDWTAPLPPDEGPVPDDLGADEAPEPSGRLVGRYVVLRPVGSGGAGSVYAAFDPHLDRRLAIKFLHRQWADTPTGRARLLSEARALARLAHPNVVTVHDVGTEAGRTFVAMELVPGEDLGRWLERGEHPLEERLSVLIAAGRGLQAAHAEGIAHGDFKPRNVLLAHTDDGSTTAVKVGDFGLARLAPAAERGTQDDSGDPAMPTTLGTATREEPPFSTMGMTGTPAYMAPEQYWRQPVDARTDQYSFCVSLWEALVGTRPFSGTLYALAEAKSKGPPAVPRDTKVPTWLFDLMHRGLEPDPAKRWPSMDVLLRRLDAGDPRRSRRRQAAFAVGGAGLLAAGVVAGTVGHEEPQCTGASGALAQVWESERRAAVGDALASLPSSLAPSTSERVLLQLDAYAEQWAEEHRAACEASVRHEQSDAALDARMTCLRRQLGALDGLAGVFEVPDVDVLVRANAAIDELPAPAQCGDVDPNDLGLTPTDPTLRADVARVRSVMARAEAIDSAGRYGEAWTTFEPLLEERPPAFGPLRAELAQLEGQIRLNNSQPGPGIEALRRAYDEGLRSEHLDMATEAAVGLAGSIGGLLGEPERAARWVEHARPLTERAGQPAERRVRLLVIQASILRTQGEYEQAEAVYGRAQEMLAADRDDNLHRIVLAGLGALHQASGRFEDALRVYEQAERLSAEALGRDHPETAKRVNDLGVAYVQVGRFEQGLALLRDSVQRQERSLGPDHLDVATARLNLAAGLAVRGDRNDDDEAITLLEKVLAAQTRIHGPDSVEIFRVLINLSLMHKRAGNVQRALELSQRALALQEATLGSDNPELWPSLHAVAVTQLANQDYDGAEATLLRMMEIADTTMPRPNPKVAEGLLALAAMYADRGRFEDTIDAYQRAAAEYEALGHPDDPNMALVIGGQALALRALGRDAEAGPMFVATIERGFERAQVSPAERSELRLGAADWLWSHPRQYDHARERALEQAELAVPDAHEEWPRDEEQIEAAERWLDAHRR